MSINPKSVEFHQYHAKPHSICLFITISKITKEIFAKICCQLKTLTRTHCIMQMSYLYASDFPFKNFCKIAQHTETIRKNFWEKSNNAYSLSIRVQTTIFYVFMFSYGNIKAKENVFFQSASWKRYCATHWRERRGWDLIFDWFVLVMRMQVILDSSFARPGSAPIWGRKKGEFRDWTRLPVITIKTRSIILLEMLIYTVTIVTLHIVLY